MRRQYNRENPNRVLVIQNSADPSEAKVIRAQAPPQGACNNLVCALKLLGESTDGERQSRRCARRGCAVVGPDFTAGGRGLARSLSSRLQSRPVEGAEWEKLYCKVVKMNKVVNVRHPSANHRAKSCGK